MHGIIVILQSPWVKGCVIFVTRFPCPRDPNPKQINSFEIFHGLNSDCDHDVAAKQLCIVFHGHCYLRRLLYGWNFAGPSNQFGTCNVYRFWLFLSHVLMILQFHHINLLYPICCILLLAATCVKASISKKIVSLISHLCVNRLFVVHCQKYGNSSICKYGNTGDLVKLHDISK